MTTTLTRWGHSCVRLDRDGAVLVVDPGSFSDVGAALAGVGTILVTHEHGDHVDVPAVVAAIARGARVVAPTPVAAALVAAGAPPDRVRVVVPGDRLVAEGFDVLVLGGEHAPIHADVPRAVNVAYLVDEAVLHPGDSYTRPPAGVAVEVLLAPLGGPWVLVADVVDYVRAVAPVRVVAIHDAHLAAAGARLAAGLVSRLGGAGEVVLLGRGESISVDAASDRGDLPVLEYDETIAPRPEEEIADIARSRPDPAGHGGDPV